MSDKKNDPTPLAVPGQTVRAKWVLDGSTTLEEAAERAEGFASWLRELHTTGWTLEAPIQDDYGHLVDPSGNNGRHDCTTCGESVEDDETCCLDCGALNPSFRKN